MILKIIINSIEAILLVLIFSSCSQARYYDVVNQCFLIDTNLHPNGSLKSIVPRCKGTPFGPMIEINDSLDILTSCVYGINDVNICCAFSCNTLLSINFNYDYSYSIAMGFHGTDGRMSSYESTMKGDNIVYNYDMADSGELLSIAKVTQDTTIVMIDRGDDWLHMNIAAQTINRMEGKNDTSEAHMKKMKPISSIDDYCRVDTTYYRSGGIKTLSQMAGKRRNGAFVKKNDKGATINISTYLDGVLEGPQFIFDKKGNIKIVGYRSGNAWIGTIVKFYKNGIPKQVVRRVDDYTTKVWEYDENGELSNEIKALSSSSQRYANLKSVKSYMGSRFGK